jgi:hypothetical protein
MASSKMHPPAEVELDREPRLPLGTALLFYLAVALLTWAALALIAWGLWTVL